MFKYRMNRSTYWVALLFGVAAVTAFAYFTGKGNAEYLIVLLGIPRLHDIGRTGWWTGLVILGEFVVVGIAAAMGGNADTILVAGGFAVIAIALLAIWLGLIPGDPNENKWGSPPPDGINWGRQKHA